MLEIVQNPIWWRLPNGLGSEPVEEYEHRREDTLVLSGVTAPGGGGQSRRVWRLDQYVQVMAHLVPRVRLRFIKICGKIIISEM